jgi:hypothetical protein
LYPETSELILSLKKYICPAEIPLAPLDPDVPEDPEVPLTPPINQLAPLLVK